MQDINDAAKLLKPVIRETPSLPAGWIVTIDEALIAASDYAKETGAIFIHPFDHEDIVAGQATIGLEILEQNPDVKTVVVCLGGGGLLAGAAMAIKELRPDVKVIGCCLPCITCCRLATKTPQDGHDGRRNCRWTPGRYSVCHDSEIC